MSSIEDGGGGSSMSLVFVAVFTIAAVFVLGKLKKWSDKYMEFVSKADALPGPTLEEAHPWFAHLYNPEFRPGGKKYMGPGIRPLFDLCVGDVTRFAEQGMCRRWFLNPYRLPIARAAVHLFDTDLIRQLLTDKKNTVKFTKDPAVYSEERGVAYPVLGDSILAHPDGDMWKRQRKIAAQAFRHDFLEHASELVVKLLNEHVFPKWDSKNVGLDMEEMALRLTVEMIGLSAFSISFEGFKDDDESLYNVYQDLLKILNDKNFLPAFVEFFTPAKRRRGKECEARLDATMDDFISKRIDEADGNTAATTSPAADGKGKKKFKDILSYLLLKGDDGKRMDYKYIKGNCRALMFAGHDTTAGVMATALWHIANNPGIQKKLQDEVDKVVGDHKKKNGADSFPPYKDLMNLPYLDAVVKEALRMAAPAPIVRDVLEDITLTRNGKDYVLPAGVRVSIMPSAAGRCRDFVPVAADEFVPERYLPGCTVKSKETGEIVPSLTKEDMNKHFMPFSVGPRNCVGLPLAWAELKTALSHIANNYNLSRNANAVDPVYILKCTIQPHEVMVDVEKRATAQ